MGERNALLRLPLQAAGRVLGLIGRLLKASLGTVSWTAPRWPGAVAAVVRRRPRHVLVALLILACAGYGWYWYRHRPHPPQPNLVTFVVDPPPITSYRVDSKGKVRATVNPLQVTFSRSAAPLALAGKTVPGGIQMRPQIKGTWTWVGDQALSFMPASDWPVGARVRVRFDVKRVFAPQVQMDSRHFTFRVPAFTAQVATSHFYEDPRHPASKAVIVHLQFDYPVDSASLAKRIRLRLVHRNGQKTPLQFTVSKDPTGLNAWVRSQPLGVPHNDRQAQLTVDSGVRSARGGGGTRHELHANVAVPGLYSLALTDVETTIVNDSQFRPQQVLILGTSDPVRTVDLASRLRAWVLPLRKAGVKQPAGAPPYAWWAGEVSESVLAQSRPLALTPVPTEHDFSTTQSFKYAAPPGRIVYLGFGAGLVSEGGYVLGSAAREVITAPQYPRFLSFMSHGALLSMSGSKRIAIVARNMPGMKLVIGRVLPDQLQYLASMNQGTYARPDLGVLGMSHVVQRFTVTRAFPGGSPATPDYASVSLGRYLAGGKRGVFLLRLSGYNPITKLPVGAASLGPQWGDGWQNTRLLVVTDLGLIVKTALDGSQDVFVQSIRTGRPVSSAVVSLLAVNGEPLFTRVTGADGIAQFPSLKGLTRDKQPALYTVSKGQDLSFLPIGAGDRQLDFSRFDVGGVSNASPGQLSAYLFSDRGLYRPGDQIHIGLIVRTAHWAHSPAGVPLEAQIVDPRGDTVRRVNVSVGASGFTDIAYRTLSGAPTGTWTINLYIVKDGHAHDAPIGSTTVQVQAFHPDRMRVTAQLTAQRADGWVAPGGLHAVVSAWNLFGTPAEHRQVSARLTLSPAWPSFRGWRDYHFYDPQRATQSYTTTLPDAVTNDKGNAQLDLDLKKYASATYQLYLQATAYESGGGRGVTAVTSALVSSDPWLIGYRATDALDYVDRGSPRSVRLVAIDPSAKSISVEGLRAQIIEERYVSVLTRQYSGAYQYVSRRKDVVLSDKPLNIPAAGVNFPLPTSQPGQFALVIRRADGVVANRIEYSVAGRANVSRSLDRNAELQIRLNKRDYKPGERIDVSIQAPYAGSGLITIERDKVYAYRWFHSDTTSTVQHIRVPADLAGNGYVNVEYVRDPSSDQIYMSPLSYAVAPFSVEMNARRNPLTVEVPKRVKPGSTITFTVHAAQPAKVVVFAVDEGILQVAGYRFRDPLAFFFPKRALAVGTSQILDLIVPSFAKLMAAAPGGDTGVVSHLYANPFKRRRQKPVVFWSGIINVKSEAQVRYRVPDYFNGTLRVMAIAVSPQKIGAFQGKTLVRGPFVLSPNAPSTLAPGDLADVTVGVANNLSSRSGQAMPVSVTLKTGPGLQIVGPTSRILALAPKREGMAQFQVRATSVLGSGAMWFAASAGDHRVEQRVDVSVRPASVYRTQLDFGYLPRGGSEARLTRLRKMYPAFAQRDASISTVPIVLARGLASYLAGYDNDCTEQIVSKAVPLLFGARWVRQHGAPGNSGPARARALARLFGVLESRQNSAGGFGLWAATPQSEPFASAYAMHVLIDAWQSGTTIPAGLISSGNRYLEQLAADDALDSLALLRQRAYAVYLLTREGNVTSDLLAAVQQRLQSAYPKRWRNDLAAAWLAASYKLLKQDQEARALMAGPLSLLERAPRAQQSFRYGYYIDPLTRNATVLYLLAKYFPHLARRLPPSALENIARPLEDGDYDTLSSAMTIMALDAYGHAAGAQLERLSIEEHDGGGPPRQISAVRAGLMRTGRFAAAASELDFIDHSTLPAWWVTRQSGFDVTTPVAPIRAGLEIVNEYTDAAGHPIHTVQVGDEIEVHVRFRAIGARWVPNIALVELLPGGFDPASPPAEQGAGGMGAAFAQPQSGWQPQYVDVREDRELIYGNATDSVREYDYWIRATNAGHFALPPAYGGAMYDRHIQAQSAGGQWITVVPRH